MKQLLADLRRLSKHAVGVGVVVAIICHLVPPSLKAPCDVLAQLCRLGEP